MELDDDGLAPLLPGFRRIAALQVTTDPAIDADDLVQEAIVRLLEARARGTSAFLPGHDDARLYINRSIVNYAIQVLRRLKFRAPGTFYDYRPTTPGPEGAALDACELDEVIALIGDDPSGDLALLRGVGYGLDEAAAILGIPYPTARMRSNRLGRRMVAGLPYRPNPGRPLTAIKRMP